MAAAERLTRGSLLAVPLLGLTHVALGVVRPPGTGLTAVSDSLAPTLAAQMVVRIVCTVCVVVSVVLGPGLYLRHRRGHSFLLGPAFVWVPGTLLLAATGLLSWGLADRVDPQVVAALVLAPLLVVIAGAARRTVPQALFVPGEAAVCGLLILLVIVGTAKASWSQGPDDELFDGTVSRTLEHGDRSDSRISYHVVQIATHGLDPYEPTADAYFDPYSFSDRGPIAGLAATPVVATAGAEPPLTLPDQAWVPFDQQGFAAYRITVEVLGATIVLAVFGLLSVFVSRRVAWQGTLLVALTPFVVHEVYFTWPKLLAASFGLAALTALLLRRPTVAGLLLGLSYLTHPVGAFVAVTVVGVWLGRTWHHHRRDRDESAGTWLSALVRTALPLAAGMAVCALVWRVANGDNYEQNDTFGVYLQQSFGMKTASFDFWLDGRVRSLKNTLVPFELVRWADAASFMAPTSINVVTLQYWSTLPFAVGIVYFPLFCVGLARFARKNLAVALAGILVPFVLFAVYWGSFVTGLMREGMQGWIVVTLLAAFLGLRVDSWPTRWAGVLRVCMTLRGLEVLVVLGATTMLGDGVIGDGPFLLTDILAVTTMVAAVGVLMTVTWRAFAPVASPATLTVRAVDPLDVERPAPLPG